VEEFCRFFSSIAPKFGTDAIASAKQFCVKLIEYYFEICKLQYNAHMRPRVQFETRDKNKFKNLKLENSSDEQQQQQQRPFNGL